LDPQDVRDVTEELFGPARQICESDGGRIEKLLGDAVMVSFGDPVARKNDAERAVRAALDFHRAVDELSPAIEARTGFGLRIHTGINTGVVVTDGGAGATSAGPLGDTVNLAARLQDLAAPGNILLGPETTRLVAGVLELEE